MSNDTERYADLSKKHAEAAEASAKEAALYNQQAKDSASIVTNFVSSIKNSSSGTPNPNKKKKGKPLNEYLNDYYFYTGKASDLNRSLALAGVAIIWIFKNPADSTILFPNKLLYPLWFLVISLGLDLLQYLFGAVIWGIFYEYYYNRKKNNKLTEEEADDLEAPNPLSIPLVVIFFAKIVFMAIAYVGLFLFLKMKLFGS